MNKALLVEENIFVTPQEYDIYHKGKYISCLICNSKLNLKASKSKVINTHFSHMKGETCESRIYSNNNLIDYSIDITNLLKDIEENISIIYKFIYNHVDNYNYGDFSNTLSLAKNRGIFHYVGLSLKYVPYILCCILNEDKEKRIGYYYTLYKDCNLKNSSIKFTKLLKVSNGLTNRQILDIKDICNFDIHGDFIGNKEKFNKRKEDFLKILYGK